MSIENELTNGLLETLMDARPPHKKIKGNLKEEGKENLEIERLKENTDKNCKKNDEEQVTVSKKYLDRLKNREPLVEAFKRLNNKKYDYILSQMYQLVSNIDSVSRDEAILILTNLYLALVAEGLEINNTTPVGKIVHVNTAQALKDFILDEPTNRDGEIKVSVKYPEWMYKGKRVMPVVVREVEE